MYSTYQIKVQGQLTENDLIIMSPQQMTVIGVNTEATLFTIYTDQSGLVGLIRHLHGRGIVFLSINRDAFIAPVKNEQYADL